MHGFPECFSDFELCRPAISKPVVLEKSDIPQKKALNSGNWKQYWNWKDFCHERLQTSFSKSGAFSVRWAWPPPGWCHAQFLSWFKELYIRAFQWYIICFRILVGTCSKLQKHMNKNLPRWFHSILAVCVALKFELLELCMLNGIVLLSEKKGKCWLTDLDSNLRTSCCWLQENECPRRNFAYRSWFDMHYSSI